MIGKKFRNLLIAAALASAAVVAVPALSQASRYTSTTPSSMAVNDMNVDVPVVKTASVKRTKAKKHTTKKLASTRKHAIKKKHTTTIVYKHHHKKHAAVKAKKPAA